MCCEEAKVSADSKLAFCWMDFQPLPKGGDACLWAGVFAVRTLYGGVGEYAAVICCVFAT
ncbi:hypothetical protein ACUXQ2_001906 [Cupriavidus metallidurans]